MSTHNEPSAEALAVATNFVEERLYRSDPISRHTTPYLARIIDAEFAALRAELTAIQGQRDQPQQKRNDAPDEITALRARLERAEEALQKTTLSLESAWMLMQQEQPGMPPLPSVWKYAFMVNCGVGDAVEFAHAAMSAPSAKPDEGGK